MIIKKMISTLEPYQFCLGEKRMAEIASIRLLMDIDCIYNLHYSKYGIDLDNQYMQFVDDESFDIFESCTTICPVRMAIVDALFDHGLTSGHSRSEALCTRILYIADDFLDLRPRLVAEINGSEKLKSHFYELDRSMNYLKFLRKRNVI